MPEGGSGAEKIEVYYKGTKYQRLAYFTNCIGIILFLAYLIILKSNKDILPHKIKNIYLKIRNR